MLFFETLCLWSSLLIYTIAFWINLAGYILKKDRLVNLGWTIAIIGFSLHTLSITARWIVTGHPPVLWTYEHAMASTWFIGSIFLFFTYKAPKLRPIVWVLVAFIMIVQLYGILSYGTGVEPLPPPYQSNWLWVHVTFAWFSYSAFSFATVVAILYLLKSRTGRVTSDGFLDRLPSSKGLEDLTFRIIIIGFIGLSIEMGAGAIWAYGLWGRYWAWDPMETWTLISWLTYALYIHLKVSMGWKGTKIIWVALLAFVFIFIAFGGIAMMKGLHAPLV